MKNKNKCTIKCTCSDQIEERRRYTNFMCKPQQKTEKEIEWDILSMKFKSAIGVLRSIKEKEQEKENKIILDEDEYINGEWQFPNEELYKQLNLIKDISLIGVVELTDRIILFFFHRIFGEDLSKRTFTPDIYDVKHDDNFFTIYYKIRNINK